MQWQFVTFIKVSACLQSLWPHILPKSPKEMPPQSNAENRENAGPPQRCFSAVNYLNWLYLSTNVARYSRLTLTLLQICSGTFQKHSSFAFMLDIMFKPRILILKISGNLFVVIPRGFESDLRQTIKALSFLFYPKSHGPLWIPDFFKFFKVATNKSV